MAQLKFSFYIPTLTLAILSLFFIQGVLPAAKFRISNNCNQTIWPAISPNGESQALFSSGFALQPGQFSTVDIPSLWRGRIWGRTQCAIQTSSGKFTCVTGDCRSGGIECSNHSLRATTVAEIALDGNVFYYVSLVHGFNLPVLISPQGGDGGGNRSNCSMTGCEADINGQCPPKFAVKSTDGEVVACNSPCDAFQTPKGNAISYGAITKNPIDNGEPICRLINGNRNCRMLQNLGTCGPTNYSRVFKRACPRAYIYDSDDATNTFNCTGGDYSFIFCPSPNTSFARVNDSGTEVPSSSNCTSYNCSVTTDTSLPHCPSFNCGGLNVGYPFWQDNGSLSQYCGYPGLGINCSRTGVPILLLRNNLNFFIRRINHSDNVVSMGDIDVPTLNQSCPRPRHNFTLSNLPLYPSSSSLNLSFYFNCSSPLSFASSIACLASSSNQSYVSLTSSQPENFSWPDYCEDNLVVTVMDSTVDVNHLNSTYLRGINQGFMLNWQPSSECKACEKTNGSCGYDRRAQTFLCFCNDGNTITGQCSGYETPNQTNLALKIGIGTGAALFAILTTCVAYYLYIRQKDSSSASGTFWKWKTGGDDKVEAFILQYGSSVPKRYRYSDVKRMTNSFKDELGKGGYGKVFKGKLADDRRVAVKVLNESKKGNGEDFMNEVASIGRTSHVNIVTLLGFCYEGRKRALIYEFMPNGSLDKYIYGNDREEPSQRLGVEKLYEIALGIARGLEYLHRGCNTRILHLDIKPHNVLLDEDFCPKLADFGLAKLYPKKKSKVSMMEARGTIGYIAPEVFNRNLGGVSDKSDVYSYGMMVIEIVGGKNKSNNAEAVRSSEIYFPDWIYNRLEQDEDLQLQQQGSMTMVENEIARKVMLVGLWCIQTDPSQRPSINKVIEMLEGSFEVLQVPPRPFFSSPTRSRSNTTTTSL